MFVGGWKSNARRAAGSVELWHTRSELESKCLPIGSGCMHTE